MFNPFAPGARLRVLCASGAIQAALAMGLLATAPTLPAMAQAGSPTTTGQPTRLPVPSQADQQKLMKTLDEAYELDKQRTDEQKATLIRELLKTADESRDRPTERFVLLRKAMELAADIGQATMMLDLVDRIAAEFAINPLIPQGKMLTKIAEKAKTPERMASFVKAANRYIDKASAQGRFDYALSIASLAYRTSQSPQGMKFRKQTLARYREVKRLSDASAAVRANPADPEANLTLGRLHCFSRGDWQHGLPYLVKGSDTGLASVATQELGAPAEAAVQVKVADAWWKLAEDAKDNEKESMMRRAGDWYKKAQAGALTGLAKVKIEKRLAEIAKLDRAAADAAAASRPKEPAAREKWIDLLTPVNLERDRISGKWAKEGSAVAVAEGGKLRLPVQIEGSYQLEVELTRVRGEDDVNIILPVGSRQCMMLFSGWGGKVSGLETIDGQRASSNPSTVKPGTMANGRRYRVTITVQVEGENAGILVAVDGRPYTRWTGKQESLSITSDWRLPCNYCPGLATISGAIFHSARLNIPQGKAVPVTTAVAREEHGEREHRRELDREKKAAKAKMVEARMRAEAAKRAAEMKRRIEAKRHYKKYKPRGPKRK